MPLLDRGDAAIAFDVHGAGPPVLLTHGFALDAAMWSPQRAPLGRGNTLVTWDMRGHGLTRCDEATAYTEAATLADMLALLDHLGIERAVIGGLSLGGFMSLAFHRDHPERVAGLLLVDTGPGYRNDDARARWNARVRERQAELLASADPAAPGHARAAPGMFGQQDGSVIESLRQIAVPTLVVVGAEDTPYLAATAMMAQRIPGAEQAVIADAGHLSNLDQPAEFNRVVGRFLERIDWRHAPPAP